MGNAMLLAEAATGALDADMIKVITNGFNTLVATVGQVVPLAIVAAVSVIGITAGANFALKKLKGVLSKAS